MSIELSPDDIDRIAEAIVAKLSKTTKLEYHFHTAPAYPVPQWPHYPVWSIAGQYPVD